MAICALAIGAIAQENIQYPVKELGNCKDKAECKTYCDNSENIVVCLDFAKKNNLMPEDEIKKAEKFIELGNKGPGGCNTKNTCDTYCDDVSNMKECIMFAKENGLISGKELREAEKALAAIEKGATPPPCKGKKECDVYCEEPAHMEECINFAVQAGFMEGKELEDAQKMLAAVKKGVKPPACRGKEECDVYCQQEEHFEECLNFSEAAGFMSADEAAMARKTGGKGPGGCRGKEECDAFCNNPANQETCFNFGKENGLISQEDLQKMEEGKQQMQQSLAQAPQEVINCLQNALGTETVEKIKSGNFMPSQATGDATRQCFEKMMPQMPAGAGQGGGMTPGAGFAGPGGCKTPDECKIYCESHTDECGNFQSSQNTPQMPMMPANSMPTGPGGCKSEQECQLYCQTNPDACKNFGPAPQQMQMITPPVDMKMPLPQDQAGQQMPMQNYTPNQMTQPAMQMEGQGVMPPMPPSGEMQPQMQPQMQSMPMVPQPQQQMLPPTTPDQAPIPPSQPTSDNPPPSPPPSASNLNLFFSSLFKAFLSIFGF